MTRRLSVRNALGRDCCQVGQHKSTVDLLKLRQKLLQEWMVYFDANDNDVLADQDNEMATGVIKDLHV